MVQHPAIPHDRRHERSGPLANAEGSRGGMQRGLAHPVARVSAASVEPEDACPDDASPSSAKESSACVDDHDGNAGFDRELLPGHRC